jgi:hypothetical protein
MLGSNAGLGSGTLAGAETLTPRSGVAGGGGSAPALALQASHGSGGGLAPDSPSSRWVRQTSATAADASARG